MATNPVQSREWLRQTIVELAQRRPHSRLEELWEIARESNRNISDDDFVEEAMRLAAEGTLALEEGVLVDVSFATYLVSWYANLWLYAVAAVSALTLLAIYLLPSTYPLVAVRWVAGSIFVLFLPGYATMQILFPNRELDDLERFALSIGLSLALVPLIGLLLNYTPWGIRLDPIIAVLTSYSIAVAIVATWRKFQILRRRSLLSQTQGE